MALALALLTAMVAPSLLAASADRLAEADEALDEALVETGEGGEDAIAQQPEGLDETVEATPGIADSILGREPDRGVGDPEGRGGPGSEPKGDRRGSRERRSARAARTTGSNAVDIRNFAYSPGVITVRAGEAVRWTNQDREPHDAEAFDGSFKTRVLQRGESDSVTFRNAGSFRYFCSIHPPSQFPDFTGTVTVLGAEAGPDGAGGAGDPASGAAAGDEADRGAGTGVAAQRPGSDRTGAGSGLPATGLGLLPLIVLGLALVSTGALVRRFPRIDRREAG